MPNDTITALSPDMRAEEKPTVDIRKPPATPSRCNRAFESWKRIGRLPADNAVIGILPGEGIGPELMAVCQLILERVGVCAGQRFEIRTGGSIGVPAWRKTGDYVTPEVETFCREVHADRGAVLCGPGGGRFVYDLRRRLDLFCKLVPLQPVNALRNLGPLRAEAVDGVDILVVRENMGGLYQGRHVNESDNDGRRVRHCFGYTERQVSRIIDVGVKLASLRRGRLCVVYKPGGVPAVSELWREQAQSLCRGKDVELQLLEVDNACYQLIANAPEFDVVVASNMFGDVLADGATVLLGSRGMSFSANFSDDGTGIYQTGHGAAHDLADLDRANPIGQIQSLVYMLREHFDLEPIARAIQEAIEQVLGDGWRTGDLMAPGCREVGTRRMGELIADASCNRLAMT